MTCPLVLVIDPAPGKRVDEVKADIGQSLPQRQLIFRGYRPEDRQLVTKDIPCRLVVLDAGICLAQRFIVTVAGYFAPAERADQVIASGDACCYGIGIEF